jgi:hypothetical protein
MKIDDVKHELWLCGVPAETVEAFIGAFLACPDVWKAFEGLTLDVISKGRRVGAKAIIERVRWDAEIERGEEWKVNNNWAPYYARVFEIKHPRYSGFFAKREIKGVHT